MFRYAFITYQSKQEAEAAKDALNGQTVCGQEIKVDVAKPRGSGRPRGPGRGGERGRGGRGRGGGDRGGYGGGRGGGRIEKSKNTGFSFEEQYLVHLAQEL